MNELCESSAGDETELQDRIVRIAEYERQRLGGQYKPWLAAVFLFTLLLGTVLMSLAGYWFFYR